MPKRKEESKKSELTLDEIIEANIKVLTDTDPDADHLENAKEISCVFFKKGKNPQCKGCTQYEEKVLQCRDYYTERIPIRPMNVWSLEFDKVEVREKKKFNALPNPIGLQCDKCYLAEHCPEYKKAASCAIDFAPEINTNEPKSMIDFLIKLQSERVQVARAAELVDGGVPDQNLSNEIDRLQGMIAAKNDMMSDKFTLKVEATAQNQGGGILSKLFGGGLNQNNQQPELPEQKPTLQIEEAVHEEVIDVNELVNKVASFDEEKLEEKKPRRRGEKPTDNK